METYIVNCSDGNASFTIWHMTNYDYFKDYKKAASVCLKWFADNGVKINADKWHLPFGTTKKREKVVKKKDS